MASFERIQKFLQLEERPTVVSATDSASSDLPSVQEMKAAHPPRFGAESKDMVTISALEPAIHVQNAIFGWRADAPVVFVADISIAKGSFTAVTGPIGCGKSTLLKGLLSETAYAQGLIQIFTESRAYCGQTPWIHDGTIRDNIVGKSGFDASWYREVIRSCELDFDLGRMPDGDASQVGSKGLGLSGGQRQRIVSGLFFLICTLGF